MTQATENERKLVLTIPLNYGSRQENVDAVRDLLRQGDPDPDRLQKLADELDENEFSRRLQTAGTPDPDMLIRTSGEMRLSNFLLWQCSYSELYISKKYWPDFRKEDLMEAVRAYGDRQRRFGAIA